MHLSYIDHRNVICANWVYLSFIFPCKCVYDLCSQIPCSGWCRPGSLWEVIYEFSEERKVKPSYPVRSVTFVMEALSAVTKLGAEWKHPNRSPLTCSIFTHFYCFWWLIQSRALSSGVGTRMDRNTYGSLSRSLEPPAGITRNQTRPRLGTRFKRTPAPRSYAFGTVVTTCDIKGSDRLSRYCLKTGMEQSLLQQLFIKVKVNV